MSGRGPQLSKAEILGKVRHLKNTLEICCINTTSTEFTSYGWTIARDYAIKVEDEVNQGIADWAEMTPGVRTNTLVMAQMDCVRHGNKNKQANKELDKEKPLCTTYNRCTTRGKCEYEVQYPDRSCQRRHECSYCRSNHNQSNKHQLWDCRKKQETSAAAPP